MSSTAVEMGLHNRSMEAKLDSTKSAMLLLLFFDDLLDACSSYDIVSTPVVVVVVVVVLLGSLAVFDVEFTMLCSTINDIRREMYQWSPSSTQGGVEFLLNERTATGER